MHIDWYIIRRWPEQEGVNIHWCGGLLRESIFWARNFVGAYLFDISILHSDLLHARHVDLWHYCVNALWRHAKRNKSTHIQGTLHHPMIGVASVIRLDCGLTGWSMILIMMMTADIILSDFAYLLVASYWCWSRWGAWEQLNGDFRLQTCWWLLYWSNIVEVWPLACSLIFLLNHTVWTTIQ